MMFFGETSAELSGARVRMASNTDAINEYHEPMCLMIEAEVFSGKSIVETSPCFEMAQPFAKEQFAHGLL